MGSIRVDAQYHVSAAPGSGDGGPVDPTRGSYLVVLVSLTNSDRNADDDPLGLSVGRYTDEFGGSSDFGVVMNGKFYDGDEQIVGVSNGGWTKLPPKFPVAPDPVDPLPADIGGGSGELLVQQGYTGQGLVEFDVPRGKGYVLFKDSDSKDPNPLNASYSPAPSHNFYKWAIDTSTKACDAAVTTSTTTPGASTSPSGVTETIRSAIVSCPSAPTLQAVLDSNAGTINTITPIQCAGPWAVAGVNQDGNEHPQLFRFQDGAWTAVDRTRACPANQVPQKLYNTACESG